MKKLFTSLALCVGLFAFGQSQESKSFIRTYDTYDVKTKKDGEYVVTKQGTTATLFSFNYGGTPNHKVYYDGDLKYVFYLLDCCEENQNDVGETYYYGNFIDNEGDELILAIHANMVILFYFESEYILRFYDGQD